MVVIRMLIHHIDHGLPMMLMVIFIDLFVVICIWTIKIWRFSWCQHCHHRSSQREYEADHPRTLGIHVFHSFAMLYCMNCQMLPYFGRMTTASDCVPAAFELAHSPVQRLVTTEPPRCYTVVVSSAAVLQISHNYVNDG